MWQEIQPILDAIQTFVLILTFIALWMYTKATRKLQETTQSQLRASIVPIVRVYFKKAPDHILLENVGPSTVPRARLANFTFRGRHGEGRVLFRPARTMGPQDGETLRCNVEILLPDRGYTSFGSEGYLFDAIQDVMHGHDQWVLDLYAEDVLGQAWRSRVTIDHLAFRIFRDPQSHERDYVPDVTRPQLVQRPPPWWTTPDVPVQPTPAGAGGSSAGPDVRIGSAEPEKPDS